MISLLEDYIEHNHRVVSYAQERKHFGTLPGADAFGQSCCDCADDVRIWLNFGHDERVIQVAYYTEGCITSLAAGSALCEMALGKTTKELMSITSEGLNQLLGGLPPSHVHTLQPVLQALKEAVADFVAVKRDSWRRDYRARIK